MTMKSLGRSAEAARPSSTRRITNHSVAKWHSRNSDRDQEGDWRWVNGELVTYRNWERGEPNNHHWKTLSTGETVDEDFGIINWHILQRVVRNRQECSWNDLASTSGYYGIMEFESDPR